jgi:hypothetical protein
MGVFYAVEGEKEQVAGRAGGRVEKVFEGKEFALAEEGYDALMRIAAAVAGELVAGFSGDTDAFGAGESQDRIHTGIAACLTLAGDGDVVEGPGSGAKSFFHRMQAVQNVHSNSVLGR